MVQRTIETVNNSENVLQIPDKNIGQVRSASIEKQIAGGTLASLGQFPWQAAILVDDKIHCGGSLIYSNWVLTAAHCTAKHYNFTIRFGTTDRVYTPPQVYLIVTTEHYEHPNYDIALLQLPRSVTSTGKMFSLFSHRFFKHGV